VRYAVRLTRREALRVLWRPGRWLPVPGSRVSCYTPPEFGGFIITAPGGGTAGGGSGAGPGGATHVHVGSPGGGGESAGSPGPSPGPA
jgi:hypothetical protein